MKYLGSISGRGVLQSGGVSIADANYELEGYVQRVGSVTGSGEIGVGASVLETLFDQPDLQLITSNGTLLDIKFTDKKIRSGEYVHVDVFGDLANNAKWTH